MVLDVGTSEDSEQGYPHLVIRRMAGSESFTLEDHALPFDLLSFWQWSTSNLVSNTTRGCLAEYIVAMALGLAGEVRNDWEACDLRMNQWNIEVKASAYLQSWFQKRLSRPSFSIRPARKWDPFTNEMVGEPCRHAHIYVFCLHDHKIKQTLNPMNLDQWRFFVLPTAHLESTERYKRAETIGLPSLLSLKPQEALFSGLRDCILDMIAQLEKC